MRNDRFEGFLWGQVLLIGLLGAALGLFLTYPSLRETYDLPELKLVLTTVFMLAGGLVAVLTANRFGVEGRRYDLILFCGFFITSVSWLAFSIGPAVAGDSNDRTELWAAIAGRMVGWTLVAVAPFVRGRARHRKFSLYNALTTCTVILILVLLIVLLLILSTCSSRCDPRYENCSSSYRTSGGSYGGYSSGGGHK